jgi:hypothetical protein
MASASLFEPDDANELLRGWLLHAHKGRDRHDLAARQCDRRRYLIGIPATIVAAIVGTSTFAALQQSPDRTLQLVVGVLAIVSAILVSLQTFLDLGVRAERHRIAGVRYKVVIRQLEQLGIGKVTTGLDAPALTELRQRLDTLEEEMPVVQPTVYDRVEAKYRDPAFVNSVVPLSSPRITGQ